MGASNLVPEFQANLGGDFRSVSFSGACIYYLARRVVGAKYSGEEAGRTDI